MINVGITSKRTPIEMPHPWVYLRKQKRHGGEWCVPVKPCPLKTHSACLIGLSCRLLMLLMSFFMNEWVGACCLSTPSYAIPLVLYKKNVLSFSTVWPLLIPFISSLSFLFSSVFCWSGWVHLWPGKWMSIGAMVGHGSCHPKIVFTLDQSGETGLWSLKDWIFFFFKFKSTSQP